MLWLDESRPSARLHNHALRTATGPAVRLVADAKAHDMRAARRSGATQPSARDPMATAAAGRQPGAAIELLLRHRSPRAIPELAGIVGRELKRQQDEIELIASENIVSRAVLEAAGTRAHQQVRRGLSRQPLLRRLPVRRRGRDAGHRARQEAVQVQLRQRAAALGQHRQPGRVHGADEARRHLHGAEPGGRRTPDARLAGQPVGQVVQGRALHGAPAGPAHRHGRGGGAGARSTSRR